MKFRRLFDKHSLAGCKVSRSNNKLVTSNIHVLTGYLNIGVVEQLSSSSQRNRHFYIISQSSRATRRFHGAIKHVEFVVGPAARFDIDTRNFACLSIEFRPALESNYVPTRTDFISLTHLFIARDHSSLSLSIDGRWKIIFDRYTHTMNMPQSCNRRCGNRGSEIIFLYAIHRVQFC